MSRQAFVTLVTNDDYAAGAVVLAESLYRSTTNKELVVLITSGVSLHVRKLLADVYDHVYLTTELYSHDDLALSMLGRPELAVTYTKLHCWRLTQYHKCVFLDADTLVLQNCDELFDREELSAVPDTGWPDCFNSGVFVFRPSLDTYAQLVSLALTKGSFDGGDQGLLNTYFGSWRADIAKRLSFVYNMQSNVSYTYAPAYLHHASGVKIVHFLGTDKPWLVRWRTDSGTVELADNQSWDLHVPFLQMWINIFREKVLPKLSEAAKNYIYKSTCMTVDQLFYRIATGDIYEYEKRPDESLPKTHFPSHEVPRVFEEAAPEPRRAVWEAPPVLEPRFIPHSAPPAPPSEPPGIPSMPPLPPPPPPSLPAAIPPPPPSWSAPCSESPRHIDVIEPTPSFYSDNSESKTEFVPPIQIIEEPCDPHWEAMFWHSVQSPWVPPSPPPPEEYQLPPSQQHYEPTIETPTFGWFSADSGARSPREEPPDIPESEPPSEHHTQTPLPQDSESSTETEDQEDVASNCETDSLTRMRSWEEGNIDYMGKDKFENIWKKLECMFTPPGPKSELEDLKESLKESFPQESVTQGGSVASSSLLDDDDDDVETLVPDEPPEPEEIWQGYPEGDYSGMFEWQEGRIDYCGRDRSDNIMRRLDFIISGGLVQDGN